MWNLNDALAFATGSAATAIDQAYSFDYPTLQDSIDSHRQNLVDTLVEYRAQIWEEEALQAFDDAIRAARRDLIADAAALTNEDAAIMLASSARYAMHDYCSAENDRTLAKTARANAPGERGFALPGWANRCIVELEIDGTSFRVSHAGRASIIWAE